MANRLDWIRTFCLSLPRATEQIQWGNDLLFKIGGKMFAVAALEPGAHWLSFKCSDEDFISLTEQQGIVPAPYLARAKWVALEIGAALSAKEIERLVRLSYEMVLAKLPKKVQQEIAASRAPSRKTRQR